VIESPVHAAMPGLLPEAAGCRAGERAACRIRHLLIDVAGVRTERWVPIGH
jgi:hypothetical protein